MEIFPGVTLRRVLEGPGAPLDRFGAADTVAVAEMMSHTPWIHLLLVLGKGFQAAGAC